MPSRRRTLDRERNGQREANHTHPNLDLEYLLHIFPIPEAALGLVSAAPYYCSMKAACCIGRAWTDGTGHKTAGMKGIDAGAGESRTKCT